MTNEINALYNEITKEAAYWTAKRYAEEISKVVGTEITKEQLEVLVKQNWNRIEKQIVELAVAGYQQVEKELNV